MKFSMKDFIALDLKGLLAVNGGGSCSSSSGGGGCSSSSSGGSGSSTTSSYVNGTLPGPNAQCWQDRSWSANAAAGSIARSSAGACSNTFQTNRAKNGDTDYSVGSSVGSGGGNCNGTYQNLLNAMARNGDRPYGAEKYGDKYMCDNFAADSLEKNGIDPADYCLDNPAGKTCDEHISDLLSSGKDYSTDVPNKPGVYVVHMNNGTREGAPMAAHTGFLVIGSGGAYFVDNSSGNNSGGVGFTEGKNASDVMGQYNGYAPKYYQTVHQPGFVL